jgi:hypothetical protein
MSNSEDFNPQDYSFLPRLIIAACALFSVGATAFPVYIYLKYGFSVQPIYDARGAVSGHVSYFFFSLAFSAFALALSWFGYKMSRWALARMRRPR